MDLNNEKKYIQEVDKKIRSLELEKARLEQQKIYTQNAIEENLSKMNDLGYTPDTIESGIENLTSTIMKLKLKINSSLGIKDNRDEVANDDLDLPF